jgi:hypothetical protein
MLTHASANLGEVKAEDRAYVDLWLGFAQANYTEARAKVEALFPPLKPTITQV